MKSVKTFAAMLLAGFAPVCAQSTLGELASRLDALGCYADSCGYEVLLPSFSDPVTYRISLTSAPAEGDTLAPCRYEIAWSLTTPNGQSEGFSAYFDGAHFRFRDARMQEYHTAEGIEPFAPGGNVTRGVQQQVQFAELLPQFVAQRFREMEADSTYIYTVTDDKLVDGNHATVVEGLQRANGYDGNEFTYIFDAATMRPVRFEFENNPGQIAEQSITVRYAGTQPATDCTINMDVLAEAHPDAFGKYRSSNYSLETLPGLPLPEITAGTLSGDRYTHGRGEAFSSPVVVAFLDTTVGSTPDVISAVRDALLQLPRQVDVIWAFVDHRADDITPLVGRLLPGETGLVHATGAARNCGVGSLTPVLLFVRQDGTVSDFIRGFNQDLGSLVIDKASVIL